MANTQAQFGFKHFGYLSGGSPDYQQSTRAISKTLATAIGFGDPVIRVSSASPYITQGASVTTVPLEGIFVGCTFIPSGGGPPQWSPFWPGNTVNADATAYVIDAPNALFLVATLQTAVTSANIGQLINYTTGVPSTSGQGYAIATIDQSTLATTSTGTTISGLPFRITGLYPGLGNGSDPTTNYNWAIVTFNNQINRSPGGGY